MSEMRVEVRRGPIVESVHRVHAVLTDAAGNVLACAGDPDLVTYWRSAAKPFQVLPLVVSGGREAFGLDEADIAVMAASHHGEPEHVLQVQHILAAAGISEDALKCGVHAPLDSTASARLRAAGEEPRAVHSNCSGKHAGMLAHARLIGADLEGYMEPSHPVQQRVLETVAAFAGLPQSSVTLSVDGCGVPVFGLPLRAMARAYARLALPASAGAAPALSFAPEARAVAEAAEVVVRSMQAHPHLVAGTGSANTAMLRALAPGVVVKGGAEGVYCLGHRRGWGLAVKVEDGSHRGSVPAALEILRLLGVIAEGDERLESFRRPPVRNVAGRVVGEIAVEAGEAFRRALRDLREAWARG